MLIKYIKSVLWRVAKYLSYIEEVRCLKVNYAIHGACLRMVLLTDVYPLSYRVPVLERGRIRVIET